MRRVGDGITFSAIKTFTTLPAPGDNVQTKIAITADIGEQPTRSLNLVLSPPCEILKPGTLTSWVHNRVSPAAAWGLNSTSRFLVNRAQSSCLR